MSLENRRSRKDLFYYANGSEVDVCDGEGKMFVNTCWSLADAATFRREKAAMAFGFSQWQSTRCCHSRDAFGRESRL